MHVKMYLHQEVCLMEHTKEHISAAESLASLPAAIKRLNQARRRRKTAIPVAILACVAEVMLVVYGAFHVSVMNLFMVLALIIGGVGIAFYFVSNWQCGERENEVAWILAFSGLPLSEIYQKAVELKIERTQIDIALFYAQQQR